MIEGVLTKYEFVSIFTNHYKSEARGKNQFLSAIRSLIIASFASCVAGLEKADFSTLMHLFFSLAISFQLFQPRQR